VSLNNIAGIERANGDLAAALSKYEESLEIRRRLAQELGTPQSHRDVSLSLDNIAGIEEANGDLDAALSKYEESLEIRRRLAQELGTPQSHSDVSLSLVNIAGIERANGDRAAALAKYEESLEIHRRLAQELGTPGSQRDVSISLARIATIELSVGDLSAALTKFEESLAIFRRLAMQLCTPQSRRDLILMLNSSIRAAESILDRVKPTDPVAAARIASSQTWVDQLAGFEGLAAGNADTLAAWWEHAAAVAQAGGNTAEASEALAKAQHWREREREFRELETKSGEQST